MALPKEWPKSENKEKIDRTNKSKDSDTRKVLINDPSNSNNVNEGKGAIKKGLSQGLNNSIIISSISGCNINKISSSNSIKIRSSSSSSIGSSKNSSSIGNSNNSSSSSNSIKGDVSKENTNQNEKRCSYMEKRLINKLQ